MDASNPPNSYQSHSYWSDPGRFAELFDAIPRDIAVITQSVQGLMLHDYFGGQLYEAPPPDILTASRNTLPVSTRLSQVHGVQNTPLTVARDTSFRAVGTCRDFALLTCSILRHQGVPARVRCGFALYFHPPTYEDHWICQYWDTTSEVWRIVDAQLDDAHREYLAIGFDPNDVPSDQFLFPWDVWSRNRLNNLAMLVFGHGESKGSWFVRVNLTRDLLALLKQEVSDWDSWREQTKAHHVLTPEVMAHCDELAAIGRTLDRANEWEPANATRLIAQLEIPSWRA